MKTKKTLLLILTFFIGTIAYSQNCTINAGITQTICTSTVTLTGSTTGPNAITWSQIAGPTAVITSPSSLTTTVTGLIGGNMYQFRISTICSDGLPTHNDVTINTQDFPTTNAGSPITICTGTTVGPLSATPLQSGETGVWTVVSGGNGLTINTPTSPTSTLKLVTGTGNSVATVLRWTVTKTSSGCTASSDVTVTQIAVNPAVYAGNDITVNNCYTNTTSTALNASFAGGGTYGTWTVITGPNTPSFSNVNTYNATLSNLIQGTYILRWTVATPCIPTTSDDVQVTVGAPGGTVSTATASIVGNPTMPYCSAPSSITLTGSNYNAATETVQWTKTGTGTAVIASPNTQSTSVSGFDGVNSNTFTYTITNTATGCTKSGTVSVSFQASETLAITNANPYLLTCNTSSVTINITKTGSTTPQWSLVSAPAGISVTAYANITGTSFTKTGLTKSGTYLFRVKKTVGTCNTIYDDINVIASFTPSLSNAGSDPILACNATTATIIGNVPTLGVGTWTQFSGPNTATIVSPNSAQTNLTGLMNGVYIFRWTISNGAMCPTNQDDVEVKIASASPTTSNAGEDQTICNTSPLQLNGNYPDVTETGTWTVSPSSGVIFSNNHAAKATVTGLAASTVYTFTWNITNNCSSSADNVIVTTSAIAGPIAALAGSDQCLPSGTTQITLAGNSPSPGTGLWTQISGGAATITFPTLNSTTVTGLSNGTYKFEWTITRNACTITRDTVQITISAAVTTANAGIDQPSVCGTSTVLAANTATIGTGVWTQVTGPVLATITNPLLPNSTVTGLKTGQYTFRWTISNNACSSSSDDVIINASTPPTPPNAGLDQTVCGLTTATMAANDITTGAGYWNVVSGPNAPSITTNTLRNTTITGLTTGTYIFSWNSSNGLCTPLSDEVVVTVIPAASAGSNQTLCGTTYTSLVGNANTTGSWTQTSPAHTVEVITPTSTYSADVTNLLPATTYTFKYTLLNADACASTKEASITVTVLASPTAASAGNDIIECISTATTTLTMAGNTPGTGTGTWTGPGTITSLHSPTTTITNVSPGINTYTWTITNGTCSSTDQVVARISRIVAPNAGNDQTICGSTAIMAATAPVSGIGTWTQTSGPNTAVFTSPLSNSSTVTGLINGTYVFRWTITDGDCTSLYDEITLNVNVAPTTPNAGTDQTLCNATSTTLDGNSISIGTGTWSKVSGPTCTFTDVSNPKMAITAMATGVYIFQWTASNGSCSELSDQVTITNNVLPTTANAGIDQRLCLYSAFNLSGNTPIVGTGAWTQISGPAVTILIPTSPTTGLSGVVAGSYSFRWTISNGTCTPSTDDVNVIVDASVTEANAGPDQNIHNVTSVIMAANTISTGQGTWTQTSGPSVVTFTNSHLAATNVTGLTYGTYVFRWTSVNGTCSTYDEVTINNVQYVQTYNIVSSPTFTTAYINWSNGNLSSRVIFMKEGAGAISYPTNSTTYTASSNWNSKGTQLGSSGYYCIYKGSDLSGSVTVTNMYPGRTYIIQAFEYMGSAGSEVYLTDVTGANNPNTVVPWPTTTFTNSNGVSGLESWGTAARWDHNTVPTSALHEAVLVYIDGNCEVNADAQSYNLTIKSPHSGITPKLTIDPGKSMTVLGGALGGMLVNNGYASSLIIKSSSSLPNGTLIYPNLAQNPVQASVEMYSKASWDLSAPKNSKYLWQFFGLPVKSINYSNTFTNYCFVREWDETVNNYDLLWVKRNDGSSLTLGSGSTMTQGKGYELVQSSPRTYTFAGELLNADFTQSLPYTANAVYPGQHIFGNPFPAAIDIGKIEFSSNTESAIYQYNTGTYNQWVANDSIGQNTPSYVEDITQGQYSVSTPSTAGGLGILRNIPSMQGFLVKAMNNNNASFTIPKSSLVTNTLQQRAPQSTEASIDERVITRIDIRSTHYADRMWIFTIPTCTKNYDNGWDGRKMLGDAKISQLFAAEADGNYQIDVVDDMNNTHLGFRAGEDADFKIKVTHQNISNNYSAVYLVDLIENKTIDVTLSGTEYSFTGQPNSQITNRFKIVTKSNALQNMENNRNLILFRDKETVFVQNLSSLQGTLILYNLAGIALKCVQLRPLGITTVTTSDVKTGAYLINAFTDNESVKDKIIIR